eukprot:scaffold277154_cov31-Tisochrysis_lutea.AAC.2
MAKNQGGGAEALPRFRCRRRRSPHCHERCGRAKADQERTKPLEVASPNTAARRALPQPVVAIIAFTQSVPGEFVKQVQINAQRGPPAVIICSPQLAEGNIGRQALLIRLRTPADHRRSKMLIEATMPARARG